MPEAWPLLYVAFLLMGGYVFVGLLWAAWRGPPAPDGEESPIDGPEAVFEAIEREEGQD